MAAAPAIRVVAAPDEFFRADSWWRSAPGPEDRLHGVVQDFRHCPGDVSHVENRFATIRKVPVALSRAAWPSAGLCLVVKDVAQVGQPLMIGRAVDGLRGGGHLFLRYVAIAGRPGAAQGPVPVLDARDHHRHLARHRIRPAQRPVPRTWSSLSPDYYGRTRTGDIMARATNDLNAVRMMLGPGVMYWFETSLTFALAIAVMLRSDWRLALYAMLPAPP